MNNTPDQDELRMRYILGDLPEEEQIALEEKFFSDDEAYQQLLALEDELRYEYARGGLSGEQRAAFERRFLQTPADRERVEVARSVLEKAFEVRRQAERPVAAARVSEAKQPWWRRLGPLFSIGSPVLQYGMVAASVLLVTGASWLAIQNMRLQHQVGALQAVQQIARRREIAREAERERLRTELAQERERRLTPGKESPEGPLLLSFVLSPGLARDAEGPKRLVVPSGTRDVRLQLGVQPDATIQKFHISLQTLEGKEIWTQDAARPVATVPGRLLAPGDYLLNLKRFTASGEAASEDDFYFTVAMK
jgi:hypothetical protein